MKGSAKEKAGTVYLSFSKVRNKYVMSNVKNNKIYKTL
jgi:hypothetical protein